MATIATPNTVALQPHSPQVQALVSFLEHEPEPMIVLDPDYNILAANTAYQRQFASSPASTSHISATSVTASPIITMSPATRPVSTAQ